MTNRSPEKAEHTGWPPKDTTFFRVYEAFLQNPLSWTTSSFLYEEVVASRQRKPMQTSYYDERKRDVKSNVFGYGSLSDGGVSSFHRLDLTFPLPRWWATKPGYERMSIGNRYTRIDAIPGRETRFIEKFTLEETQELVVVARSFFPFMREAPPPSEEDIERAHVTIESVVSTLFGQDMSTMTESAYPYVAVDLQFFFDRNAIELAFTALDEARSGRSGIKVRNQPDGKLALSVESYLSRRPVATYEVNLETANFAPVFDFLLAGVKAPNNPAKKG